MDALKDACRASGDYSITLIPYYAQVIADFDTADTVRQRRFESLQKLHGQLHLYKKRGYDAELLCSLAARKAELIMKASTKADARRPTCFLGNQENRLSHHWGKGWQQADQGAAARHSDPD